MKFSTREDIEAPIDQVFDAMCDFESFERQAMRRGAEVQRIDPLTQPGVGMKWKTKFMMRGRQRKMKIEMVKFDHPNEMVFEGKSPNMEVVFSIELVALSPKRTRIAIATTLTPLNLGARLLIQSLKLAKANLTKRFKLRVADHVKTLEERIQRTA